jgi:hypothetical protein
MAAASIKMVVEDFIWQIYGIPAGLRLQHRPIICPHVRQVECIRRSVEGKLCRMFKNIPGCKQHGDHLEDSEYL